MTCILLSLYTLGWLFVFDHIRRKDTLDVQDLVECFVTAILLFPGLLIGIMFSPIWVPIFLHEKYKYKKLWTKPPVVPVKEGR